MNCSTCRLYPEKREQWGCDKPSQVAVKVIPGDDGEAWEYYSCPLRFIPASVCEFLERKAYMEKYPHTAPSFDQLGARWREFERYFDGKVDEFERRVKRGA